MNDVSSPASERPWPPGAAALQRLFSAQRLAQGRRLQSDILELHASAHGANARLRGPGDSVFELALQGLADADGQPQYSALCSCRQRRFCVHAAAVLLRLQAEAEQPRREQALQQWVQALRRRAPRAELQRLPQLAPQDAARLMDLMQSEDPVSPAAATAAAEPPAAWREAAEADPAEPARFQPLLRLSTLGRGQGLLGLSPTGKLGPRGDQVSIAEVSWTYAFEDGSRWSQPAPRSLLNSRPPRRQPVGQRWLVRDLAAEAQACDQLWESGLQPLDATALQWRDAGLAPAEPDYWTLTQEAQFDEFWLTQVPALQAQGWRVEVQPGFAHRPAPAGAWRAELQPLPRRQGSWLLSLGVEVEGELLDLAPMIADLLRRDARWLNAQALAEIEDGAVIRLRAPGGRCIEAPARMLKAIVGAIVDLLEAEHSGPLTLSPWDAASLAGLDLGSGWQLQGDAALREIAARLLRAGSPPPVEPPTGLGLTLRSYQRHGLAWLQYLRAEGLGGILADEMGLGKTAQTLAHVLLEKQAGRLDRPALVVLPSSLLFNWAAEAQRITPELRVLLLQGAQRRALFEHIGAHDLVLTSYPLLWRDIEPLAAQPWHLLILDEAQTVKNAGSRAARAVRQLKARHRLCLSGTPLENHLGELWAQFDFLMPGLLGDARSFARRWRKPIEEAGSSLHAEALARRVRPFMLRRRKAEVEAELPPLSTVTRAVELQGRQRELYESVRVAADHQVRRALARQGFAAARITVLDALLKLRQVCCDPRLLLGEAAEPQPGMERAKLDLLMDMLPALLAEGRRVLVFSQFARMLALVGAELDRLDLPYDSLTGATPAAQRARLVQRFQNLELPLMLVSLKAGGVGLNLTAADTVIQLDPWWNPAVMDQANARAHRIGQDRPVFVYQLVVAGSIEERMLALQARKKGLAEAVLGNDPAAGDGFRPEDLELLLAPLEAAGGLQ